MKRIVVLVLLVAMLAPMVFADDAKVLPQGISRVTFVPVLTFVMGAWDQDGEQTDNEDAAGDSLPDDMVFALGGAYEYGLTNQISLGLQWAPAYQFYSDADATGSDSYDVQTGGFEQIDLGAEIQVLGEQGYMPNEMFRFSVTPGFGIALPQGIDWGSEGESFARGEDAIAPGAENRTEFQIGALVNFDYIISDVFEWNVFTEARYRFARTSDYGGFYNKVTAAELLAGGADAYGYAGEDVYSTYEVEYGPTVYWEIGTEPKAAFQVADSLRLTVGVTGLFALTTAQEQKSTVEATATGTAIDTALDEVVLDQSSTIEPDDPSYVFSVEPSLSAFVTALPLPLEFVTSYKMGLAGQSSTQTQSLIFKLRAFF